MSLPLSFCLCQIAAIKCLAICHDVCRPTPEARITPRQESCPPYRTHQSRVVQILRELHVLHVGRKTTWSFVEDVKVQEALHHHHATNSWHLQQLNLVDISWFIIIANWKRKCQSVTICLSLGQPKSVHRRTPSDQGLQQDYIDSPLNCGMIHANWN